MGDAADMTAYLFVDTFAFEKLAKQAECRVGQRGATMAGYETYLIEQWACERRVNTVVASYTGNAQHVVEVQVLWVPTSLKRWSPVTFAHFEELVKMHILPKETPLGNMLVTSLSSLPSNLSLVSMPRQYRVGYANFVINEDLRRLNVVGRIAVTADEASESVVSSFRRAFVISPVPKGDYAVQEAVTLMQIALFYFGLLEPAYVDGFLCLHTVRAIETWWSAVGRQRYKTVVPRAHDKLYMRTSCAALVGIIVGARQRLSALGLKPPKDPFDADNFVATVRRFQKMAKLPRTAILDDHTYAKLVQDTSAKIASAAQPANVLSMMKSTVKEGLSGKVAEEVDDWETLDLEVLAQNIRGERGKYLWQGKGVPQALHLRAASTPHAASTVTKIPLFSLPSADAASQDSLSHHLGVHLAGSHLNASKVRSQSQPAMHGLASSSHHTSHGQHHNHHPHVHHHHQANGGSGGVNGGNNNNSNNNGHSSAHGSSHGAAPQSAHKDGAGYFDLPTSSPYQHPSAAASAEIQSPAKRKTKKDPYHMSNQSVDGLISHGFSSTDGLDGGRDAKDAKDGKDGREDEPHKSLVHRFRNRRNVKVPAAELDEDVPHAWQQSMASLDHHWPAHHDGRDWLPPLPQFPEGVPVGSAGSGDATSAGSHTTSAGNQSGGSAAGGSAGAGAGASFGAHHDDIAVHRRKVPPPLQRTASLSQIEGTVFPWEGLAPVPEVLRLYEQAQTLQTELKGQMEKENTVRSDLSARIAANETRLAESLRDNMVIKYHVSASTKKEDAVRRRLRELEAFMARMDYELATLTVKLNDVDDSVRAFKAKVDSAEARWAHMNREVPASSSWWSGWFG